MSVPAEFCVLECRRCGAPIFFARTQKMANMPLEARAVKDRKPGELLYRVPELKPGETQHKCIAADGAGGDEPLFRPHWGSCPGADGFRKKKERAT